MHSFRRALVPAAGAAALLTACSESPTSPPSDFSALDPSSVVAAACETIDFDEFAHGAAVTSVSALGLNLTVAAVPYSQPSGAGNPNTTARAFDTDVDGSTVEDDDLAWLNGDCSACSGLGSILVIDDERNTAGDFFYGDYRWGGTLRISGFTGGSYYVESFTYVDNDNQGSPENEPPVLLKVDGTTVGSTTPGADGNVQVVPTASTTFSSTIEVIAGTAAADMNNGSGGVDDIRVCRVATGFGTRTPGYWKNHPDAWPATITIGGDVFTKAEAIAIMNSSGQGNKAWNMFSQLVAAKLNVLNGSVASCIDETIADADVWMETYADDYPNAFVAASSTAWKNGGEALHTTLDQYNNGNLCAPKGD